MKRFLLAFVLMCGIAHAQQTPVVTNPTFGDDTYVQVPLQFGFPFYGRTFTNSWMHSNGIVSFLDPAVPIEGVGYNPGAWAYCCGDRPTYTRPEFSYMIAPLWTDLYPDGVSTFRTEGTTQYQKYFWNNLGEISNTSNRNTFSLEIRPSGFIGVDYTQINMNQTAWIGTVGNPAAREINEIFYGRPGINYTGLTGWSSESTPVGDICLINPLSSPTCSGYTEAMCSSNPLYSSSCSGYATAYFNQQCSLNPLYNPSCAGYASAYLDYQCSMDPLYSTSCQGYSTAYFNQQCSLNPLYDSACPGYNTAYLDQQCSLNPLYSTACSGYADAYYVQQCTANPLYDSGCTGYATAYFNQQCTADPLYNSSCPGYTTAYFDQQCSLDALYNNQCPGYASAYALKYVVITTPTTEPSKTQVVSTEPSRTEAQPSISSDGTVNTKVSVTGDSAVDNAIDTKATSASPAAAATATVSLVPAPRENAPSAPVAVVAERKQEKEKKEEAAAETSPSNKESGDGGSTQKTAQSGSSSDKKEQPTPRQVLAERRLEAAKAKAVEEGKNLANKVGEAATMEAQVAIQNVVIAAMGFTPGFQTYNVMMPDVAGYKPYVVYANQKNVDNRFVGSRLFSATDRLHNDMVDSQYNRKD